MRLLLQTIKFLLGIVAIGGLHIAIAYVFPFPFHMIHVMFIAIVMILFLYEHGSIVWFAAAVFLMLDFPSAYPFGLSMFSGVVATTVMLLLYRHVFTNRSLPAALALCSIGYVLHRSFFLLVDMFSILDLHRIDIVGELEVYGLQLIMTLAALSIVYSIVSQLSYQLQHTSIQESWFRTLQQNK